jgi:hypothetical protein
MKKTITLLTNLLLSSALFLSVPLARGDVVGGQESIVKVPSADGSYCHMKFPPMREETLSWDKPVLNETAGNVIDFYGPCDHDPTGKEEIENQRRDILHGYFGDGDSD